MTGQRWGKLFTTAAAVAVAGFMAADRSMVLAQTSASSTTAEGCVADYNASAGVDYFPDKAEINFAESFTVEYFPAHKVVTISSQVYVLYQCGTPQPDLADIDVRLYISVPVTTVATGTPDHIPRIEVSAVAAIIMAVSTLKLVLSCDRRFEFTTVNNDKGVLLELFFAALLLSGRGQDGRRYDIETFRHFIISVLVACGGTYVYIGLAYL